jgi:tetratricopeptide (TPR) repeat protein
MWVSDSYEDIAARAGALMENGDLDEARDELMRITNRLGNMKPDVLARRPGLRSLLTMSLLQLTTIHRFQGDFDKALAVCQQLGSVAPHAANLWRRIGAWTRIDRGEVEQGLDELRAEAVAAPGDYEVWLTIGVECAGLGRAEEAEENLRRAVKNAHTPRARLECHLALFDLYRQQGRVEEALAEYEAMPQLDDSANPDVSPVYQMLLECGDTERAAQYIAREPNPLRRGFYEGLVEARQGKADEAQKRWQKVARTDALKYEEGHEAWAEAALRVNVSAEHVAGTLQHKRKHHTITQRGLLMLAVAEARLGRLEDVKEALAAARNQGLYMRPRRELLPGSDWAVFEELVSDDDIKRAVRHFFADSASGDGQTT